MERKPLSALEEENPDLVLTDIRMPGATGMDVLARAREVDPELPVILMTAQASLQSAVRAVNEGAYYYLQKPFANDELTAICRRALEARELKAENRELKKEIKRRVGAPKDRPIGTSRSFLEVLELVETVAPTDSTLLISGESGTGKEVLARYIHALSDRSDAPFFSINCGALPESLLESELVRPREGLLHRCDQGQAGSARGRGGRGVLPRRGRRDQPDHPGQASARAAGAGGHPCRGHGGSKHRRPHRRGDQPGSRGGDPSGQLPERPLLPTERDRPAHPALYANGWKTSPLLTSYFLEHQAVGTDAEPKRLTDDAMDALMKYDWPGNVRELENALERAAVLCPKTKIPADALPERVCQAPAPGLVSDRPPAQPVDGGH